MPRSSTGISYSFADVYDALYEDPAFLQAQMAFLGSVFGPPPLALLDLGCGTGAHLVALSRLGHRVVGLDVDLKMLRHARSKLPAAQVIRADLRHIPFRRAFEGALCLESPLAYLLDDVDLSTALPAYEVCCAMVPGW